MGAGRWGDWWARTMASGPGLRQHGRMRFALLIATLSLALAACGGDDATSTEDAAREASELAERTQQLAGEAARTGRSLAEDQIDADAARDELQDIEDRANELSEQAQDLPDSTETRDEIQQANERVADAAQELADRADQPAERRQAYEQARERLEDARGNLGDVADRLRDELPAGAREDLESLQEQLSNELP